MTPHGRLRQVKRWLEANHPAPLPVRLVVGEFRSEEDEDVYTTRTKRGFDIRFRPAALARWGEEAIETLLHEWAHVLAWRDHLTEEPFARFHAHHDDEWSLAYGRLYRDFFDETGKHDSREFSAAA